MADNGEGMLLGKVTAAPTAYDPAVLYPIPRATGRATVGLSQAPAFSGVDLWHAYELSWLDRSGKPEVRVGRIIIPASSPNMVESKSLKLYLNSLNNTRYDTAEAVAELIRRDISAVLGSDISIALLPVTAAEFGGRNPEGECIDQLDVGDCPKQPDAEILATVEQRAEDNIHSHLLRSLCPVTGQPDWATVWIHYSGQRLDRASLLRYLISFREHQGFHEQCVERIFTDLWQRTDPDFLHVQAFYTRRGGLDINPLRSTDPHLSPHPRMNRQ